MGVVVLITPGRAQKCSNLITCQKWDQDTHFFLFQVTWYLLLLLNALTWHVSIPTESSITTLWKWKRRGNVPAICCATLGMLLTLAEPNVLQLCLMCIWPRLISEALILKVLKKKFFFSPWAVLGLRASCLLGRHSTTWATPPALFYVGCFWDAVLLTICPGWLWTAIFLISASWVARITGVSHRCPTSNLENLIMLFHW
jgi:hypothetical protein